MQIFSYVSNLVASGNGALFYSAEEMFGRNAETIFADFNPQTLFLILILILFLADIAVRKFKLKWPFSKNKAPNET